MKKHIYAFSAIAAGILMAAGCQMTELEEIQDNRDFEINEESAGGNFCVTFDCYQPQTRTEFHDNTIWWSAGDRVMFGQYTKVEGAWKSKTTSNTGFDEAKPSFSMNVSSFNTPATDTITSYFSVYPYAAYKGFSSSNGIPYPRITLKQVQSPNGASFDPEADLLVSELILSQADTTATHFKMKYTRPGAIGKMAIANLPSTESIESIKFIVHKEGVPVVIAGSRYYDLEKGEVAAEKTNINCNDQNYIALDYSNCEVSGDMTAYFTCYPFELVAGDSFTVSVKTKIGEEFTKFVSLADGQELKFTASLATRFTVDMSSSVATGVPGFDVKIINTGVQNIYYTITGDDIASFTRNAYSKTKWLALTPEQQSAELDSAKVGTIGNNINLTGLKENTSYIVAAKITDKNGKTFIIQKETATTWFGMRAITRSSGGIQVQIAGRNLAYGTRAYRTVRTSELAEVTDLESFYMNTVKPGSYSQETLDAIMAKNGATINYSVTADYLGNELIPDESYTLMMKAVSTTGQVLFVASEAIAK